MSDVVLEGLTVEVVQWLDLAQRRIDLVERAEAGDAAAAAQLPALDAQLADLAAHVDALDAPVRW